MSVEQCFLRTQYNHDLREIPMKYVELYHLGMDTTNRRVHSSSFFSLELGRLTHLHFETFGF